MSAADEAAMESWLARLGVDVCLKHAIAVLLETSPRPDTLGAAVDVIAAELRKTSSSPSWPTPIPPLPTPTTVASTMATTNQVQLQVQLRLPASGRYGTAQATTPPPALCTGATTLREFSKYAEVETGIDPLDQEWILSMRRQVAEAMGETKGSDDDDDDEAEAGYSTGAPATAPTPQETSDAAALLRSARLLPRQMKVDETAAWVRSQGALSPRDKRLLNRGRFMGYNLVGSSLTQPLTEDDVHKATGVIFHMTKAELKATYDKADITGHAPEFEDAVVDGEILYELFTTQSFEAVVGDYFQTDELRPLGERLWADLKVIDDASRARDAHRIFCILTPLLADLQARQEKGDGAELAATEQAEMEGRRGKNSNRRYAAAATSVEAKPGDDPPDADDAGGEGDGGGGGDGGEDDGVGGAAATKVKCLPAPPLDLVARAFAATTTAVIVAGGSGGAEGASTTQLSTPPVYPAVYPADVNTGAKLLADWNRAVETRRDKDVETDWKGMTVCGDLFTQTSMIYGQCIVEGRADTGEMQAFTAKKMGGIAGGKKFVEKRILFKFADPMGGPYNSSFELSQKAAAHDLRGATAFVQYGQAGQPEGSGGVSVSLQTLVDYAGFRLQAMQMLPIGQGSLIIGSGDACETLPKAEPAACAQFKIVADKMGLAEHSIRVKVGGNWERVRLHFGADVEGHRGKDDRLYVLDTARTFPPECMVTTTKRACSKKDHPEGCTKKCGKNCDLRTGHLLPAKDDLSIYWRLARPELLRKWAASEKGKGKPVSSDAFSLFAEGAKDAQKYNGRATNMTKFMLKTCVPAAAAALDRSDAEPVSAILHREGVNVRHLDKLLATIKGKYRLETADARVRVAREMLERTIKNLLRRAMRDVIMKGGNISQLLELAALTFNCVTGADKDVGAVEAYWGEVREGARERFGGTNLDKFLLLEAESSIKAREEFHAALDAIEGGTFELEKASDAIKNNEVVVRAAVTKSGKTLEFASDELKDNEAVVLAAVSEDGRALEFADHAVRNNTRVVLAAVTQNGEALRFASDELKNSTNVALAAVTQTWEALKFAGDDMKNVEAVMVAAVSQNGKLLKTASEEWKNIEAVVVAAVTQNWQALQYTSEEMKNNKAVVMAAITQDGYALEHASDEMKNTKAVVMAAVTQCGYALRFVSKAWKKNEVVVVAAILRNWESLEHASDELRNTEAVVMAAVTQDGDALQYASKEMKNNETVVVAAITQNWTVLRYANDDLKNSEAFMVAAVTHDGRALKYASEEMKDTEAVVVAAVTQNGMALKKASEEMRNNEAVVLAAVTQNGEALEKASEEMKDTETVVLAAVTQNGEVLYYASEEMKNNEAVVMAAVTQNGGALQFAGMGDCVTAGELAVGDRVEVRVETEDGGGGGGEV
jgi:hypothetical protein